MQSRHRHLYSPSTSTKRKITTLERPISPPPLKRKNTISCEDTSALSPRSTSISTPTLTFVQSYSPISSREVTEGNGEPEQGGDKVRTGDRSTEIEVLSWNVNGVTHLLATSTGKITSFFSSTAKRKTGNGELYHSEDEKMRQVDRPHGNKISPLRVFLKRHCWPQILCLQEVKIAPSDKERMVRVLEKAANYEEGGRGSGSAGSNYSVYLALPRDRYNAPGFGGRVHGVCSLIRKDLEFGGGVWREGKQANMKTETKTAGWDLEGRVLITEIEGQNHTDGNGGEGLVACWKLVVINGYWPNGTTNPYRSSTTGEIAGTRHGFKRSFHDHILTRVDAYQKDGWHVLLIGDMNIAPQRIDGFPNLRSGAEHLWNREDFNKKFLSNDHPGGMGGVDTFRRVHGQLRKYSYHGERAKEWGMSCDRVDLGIVSREVVLRGALIGAEIWESVEERGGSDHVPIGVVINVARLGGNLK